jgi:histidinol-phosphate aminotransferase
MTAKYDVGLEYAGENILSLHRNENQFIERQILQEFGKEASSNVDFFRYPDSQSSKLRAKLAEIYHVTPEHIYVGNGADGVLADLFQYLRNQYDEIGTTEVTYRVYPYLCKRYGYTQTFIHNRIPKLCIIDSPNSITGEIFDFSKINPEFLIYDKVYGEFSNDQIEEKHYAPNRVIIRSFSKFYGLATLRIGYCIASPDLVTELFKRKDVFNVNGFAQAMALRALEEKERFDALLQPLWEARDALKDGMLRLGLKVSDSKANFLWFFHPNAEAFQKRLTQANLIVRHFNEPLTSNYLRITIPKLEQVDSVLKTMRELI